MREPEVIGARLVEGIRDYFGRAGFGKAVLGLSGGIDSALCVSLLREALGAKNVTALILPYKKINPSSSAKLAKSFAKREGINCIVRPVDSFMRDISTLPWKQGKLAEANSVARVRAVVLYNYANSNNSLVVGAGNKSEIMLGYFTKYGDAAADVFPIGALWKTQVLELAKARGIPEEITSRTPSAELWKGQTDAAELGAGYDVLDEILQAHEAGEPRGAAHVGAGNKLKQAREQYGSSLVEKVVTRIKATEHKRQMPPVIDA
ncbi:MAG: NAD(+) synthase [Candidatus Diapherotrites archaeon]